MLDQQHLPVVQAWLRHEGLLGKSEFEGTLHLDEEGREEETRAQGVLHELADEVVVLF